MESKMSSNISCDNPPPAEHVTKASSDELLKKFAQVGSKSDLKKELHLAIAVRRRRKINNINNNNNNNIDVVDRCDSPSGRRASWPEGRSLLPTLGKKRKLGRSFNNKSIFGTIRKTWRRTVEGASKVFVEKHFYNRHKRLINDSFY